MHILAGTYVVNSVELPRPDNRCLAGLSYLDNDLCQKSQRISRGDTLCKIVTGLVHAEIFLFIPEYDGQVSRVFVEIQPVARECNAEVADHDRAQKGWHIAGRYREGLVLACGAAA